MVQILLNESNLFSDVVSTQKHIYSSGTYEVHLPIQICNIFMYTFKGKVEPCEDFNVVVFEFFIKIFKTLFM